MEYREDQDSNKQSINHVMDDTRRIATIREGDTFGDTTPAIKYNLDDHLGSSNVLVDENGTLVNQEEYYPFGETSFGSYAKKRYRFCGKEKDEESGMYYYGARYYSPWLCRFISVDPLAAKYPFYTPFQYAGNKPINFIDLDGREEFDIMYNRQTGEAFVRLVDYRSQATNTGIKLNEVTTTNRRDPNFAIISTTDFSQFADIQGGYFDVIKVTSTGVYFLNPNGNPPKQMRDFSSIQENSSGNPYQPDYSEHLRFNPNNATQMRQVDVPQSTTFNMVKAAGGTPSTVQTYQITIPPSSTTATMTINAGMDSQISNSLVVTDSNNNVVSTTASSTNPNGQVFDTVNLTDVPGNTSITVQPGQTYTFTVTAGSTTPQDAYNITVTIGTTNPVMIPSTGNPQSIPATNPTTTPVQPTTSR
jgi:RHS repeat-associated protein